MNNVRRVVEVKTACSIEYIMHILIGIATEGSGSSITAPPASSHPTYDEATHNKKLVNRAKLNQRKST